LKLKLHVKNNDWNIVPKDLFQPLSRLHEGPAKGILACLNTKRILITYHGNEDSEDETTDSTESESDSDDETDTTEDESDSPKSSVEVDNPPPKKRARKNSKTGSSKKKSGSSKKKSVTSKKKPVTKSKSAVNQKSTSSKQKRTSAASTNQNSDTVTTQNSNTLTTQNSDISGAQEGGTGLVGDSHIQSSIDPLLETLA
jgi:cytoskeletal protein RodZ